MLTIEKIREILTDYMDQLQNKNKKVDNRLIHGLFKKDFKTKEEMNIRQLNILSVIKPIKSIITSELIKT